MNNILFFSHEFEEVQNNLNIIFENIYSTETIVKFLILNGRNSFNQAISVLPFPCAYCIDEIHLYHQNKYACVSLNKILDPQWYTKIYVKFFSDVEVNDFFNWINTYVKRFLQEFTKLKFIEVTF